MCHQRYVHALCVVVHMLCMHAYTYAHTRMRVTVVLAAAASLVVCACGWVAVCACGFVCVRARVEVGGALWTRQQIQSHVTKQDGRGPT